MNNKDTQLLAEKYQQVTNNKQQVDEGLGGLAAATATGAALGGGLPGAAIGAGLYGAGKLAGAAGKGIRAIGQGLGGVFTGQGWSAGRIKGKFTADVIPAYEEALKSMQKLKTLGIKIPDILMTRLGVIVGNRAKELSIPFKGPTQMPQQTAARQQSDQEASPGVPTEGGGGNIQKVNWPEYAWAGSELPDREIKRFTSSTPDGRTVTANSLFQRTMPDGQKVVYSKVGQAPYAPNERIPEGDIVEVNGRKRVAQ